MRHSTIARQVLTAVLSLTLLLVAGACGGSKHMAVQVEGHYTYQHGWSYDIAEGHIDVHETGTMDFYHDGTALDSARQNYSITLKDGGSMLLVFNYISPSRWRAECEDFCFAGIAETFRMTLIDVTTVRCENTLATDLARRIIHNVGKGIARETKFHLDKLTPQELVWSYTYSDGHSDTWEFYRSGK